MILPSKSTTMATSKMEKEALDRPNPMRVTRKNGKSPEFNRLSTPPCTYMCPNLARVNPRTADLTTFQLRDEDSFDQRQSSAAAQASRTYPTVSEKRNDHNNDYIGHWPRKQRDGHKEAVDFARKRSIAYGDKSQRHRDVRRLAFFF